MSLRDAGSWLALLSAVLLAAAGPGCQLDLWTFKTGFSLLRWAAYGGLAGAALSALAAALGWPSFWKGRLQLVGAAALGLGAAALPWRFYRAARAFPPIHDLTTDPVDPPVFSAVLPPRQGSPNPVEYGGADVFAQQRAAYPDLKPLILEKPPLEVFAKVESAARRLRWEVIFSQAGRGVLEATDTTLWFGFKDDIAVRVRPQGKGTRVDARSVSRVGKGDAGANAKRLRRFLDLLR